MSQYNVYLNKSTDQFFLKNCMEGETVGRCISRYCRALAAKNTPVIDAEEEQKNKFDLRDDR